MIDNKIKTLLMLESTRSYTKAAQALSLTQPAVSYHIRQLEEEFQTTIFFRGKKELKLTPEGKILVRYAHRMMALSNAARQAIEDSKRELKRVSVGITPTAGEYFVPQILAKYSSSHPNVRINVITDTIKKIYTMLNFYEIDIAIVDGNLAKNNFTSILLDTDYLCLAVSPAHPFARRKSVSLEELRREKLILRLSSAGTRMLFENFLAANGDSIRNYNVIFEMDNVTTIKELVIANLGVTVIARSACREECDAGRLVVVPVENLHVTRELNMVYHQDFAHPEILDDILKAYQSK